MWRGQTDRNSHPIRTAGQTSRIPKVPLTLTPRLPPTSSTGQHHGLCSVCKPHRSFGRSTRLHCLCPPVILCHHVQHLLLSWLQPLVPHRQPIWSPRSKQPTTRWPRRWETPMDPPPLIPNTAEGQAGWGNTPQESWCLYCQQRLGWGLLCTQHQGGTGTQVLVSAGSCHQARSLGQLHLSSTSETHIMWGQRGL